MKPHKREIYKLTFSNNDEILVSGSKDRTVKVWRTTPTVRLTEEIKADVFTFEPTQHILAYTNDKSIRVKRREIGKQEMRLEGHRKKVTGVAISRDGLILISYDQETIHLWALHGGWGSKGTHRGEIKKECHADLNPKITPDCNIVACANQNGEIDLWDSNIVTGKPAKVIGTKIGPVQALEMSRDGKVLASGNIDGSIDIFSLPEGNLIKTLKGHEGAISAIAISPDGRLLASSSKDGEIKLWNRHNLTLKKANLRNEKTYASSLTFNNCNTHLYCGDTKGNISLRPTQSLTLKLPHPAIKLNKKSEEWIRAGIEMNFLH